MDVFNIGEDISESVQHAVNTGDFSDLNRTVRNVVKGGGDANYWSVDTHRATRYTQPESHVRYTQPNDHANHTRSTATSKKESDSPYMKNPPGNITGLVMEVAGVGFAAFWGITFLSTLLLIHGPIGFSAFFGLLTVANVGLFFAGKGMRGLVKRFERYRGLLNGKDYCAISDLAQKTGKSESFVVRDLKKMMGKGFFKEARLDNKETTLLVTDEVYKQYQQAMASSKLRDDEEAARRAAKEKLGNTPGMTKESLALLEEGQAYIEKIRKCNDEIPGEEISAKLTRLEAIMTRIFDQVKVQPDLTDDLHKFMNYYLPTTAKLIEAYRDMDQEKVEVENITKTKKEIEDTLDTINDAFEKLLDSLFEAKAWDISSDINVMKTMMKNDGMSGSDFAGQTMTR